METIETDGLPYRLVQFGTGMWVTMYNLGVVDVFSVASRELRLVVPVGSIPYGIATDGTAVWVANNGAGTVSKLTTIQGGP